MNVKKTPLLALVAIILLGAVGAQAHETKMGQLTVKGFWARATVKTQKTGAGYMTIHNAGQAADRLVAVKSDVAAKTELHQSFMKDGIMKMQHTHAVEVPAGGMAVLKPGGYHVMFLGLKAPLTDGTMFPVTLVFEKAGEMKAMVRVSKKPGMDHMKHGKKMH